MITTWSQHRLQGLRAKSHKSAPLQMSVQVLGALGAWVPLSEVAAKSEVFTVPPFRFDNVLEQSTDPFTYYHWFIIKDKLNEQLDEEIHSVGSRRVLHTGTSIPVNVGVLSSEHINVSTNSGSSDPIVWLFYGGLLHRCNGLNPCVTWWLGPITRTPALPGDL